MKDNWIHSDAGPINQRNGIVFGEHVSNSNVSINGQIEHVGITGNYIDLQTLDNSSNPSGRGLIFTNQFRNSGATITFTNFTINGNTIDASDVDMFASACAHHVHFRVSGDCRQHLQERHYRHQCRKPA